MSQLFTVDLANRMLPLVKRIVRDIVDTRAAWQEKVREFEMATALSRADRPSKRAVELEKEVQRLAHEVEGFVIELGELGVQLKDFEMGLVDFPSEIDGQPACLCWKLDEASVMYWHEEQAGYANRRPLAPAFPAA